MDVTLKYNDLAGIANDRRDVYETNNSFEVDQSRKTRITTDDLFSINVDFNLVDSYAAFNKLESMPDTISPEDESIYKSCVEHLQSIASLLQPTHPLGPLVSRSLQKKIIALLNCPILEPEGRSRALRTTRSIGERVLSELLIKHQDPHSLNTNLWAAVRSRGCQFLGPAMQEEVLKLVLLALEDGSALSRKVLVMFVVQRLSPHFPHQASKTAIGHVIQLLYRASCFKLTKRDGDSSLMQMKEEYCSYESLRREHDTQIVQIAMEAGLRISPDQWSTLLYGDTDHKSHMQSIIDQLQSPHSFHQSIQELVTALQRTGDSSHLSTLRPHFDRLSAIDITASEGSDPSLSETCECLQSASFVTVRLVEFLSHFGNGSFRGGHHLMTSGPSFRQRSPQRQVFQIPTQLPMPPLPVLTVQPLQPRLINPPFVQLEAQYTVPSIPHPHQNVIFPPHPRHQLQRLPFISNGVGTIPRPAPLPTQTRQTLF